MLLEGYHPLWSSLLSEGMHHSLCCFMMPKWTLFCMCDQASPFVQKISGFTSLYNKFSYSIFQPKMGELTARSV
uniref:Uncharacterized protein n=1 Tax=Aegilops tauschii subsp. strangulata TaxID=200361 RepID=A0A453K0U7_AEGTS